MLARAMRLVYMRPRPGGFTGLVPSTPAQAQLKGDRGVMSVRDFGNHLPFCNATSSSFITFPFIQNTPRSSSGILSLRPGTLVHSYARPGPSRPGTYPNWAPPKPNLPRSCPTHWTNCSSDLCTGKFHQFKVPSSSSGGGGRNWVLNSAAASSANAANAAPSDFWAKCPMRSVAATLLRSWKKPVSSAAPVAGHCAASLLPQDSTSAGGGGEAAASAERSHSCGSPMRRILDDIGPPTPWDRDDG
mmetsp:Transcript_117442/g.336921  ORF Transcript_117442/g.336921 Transcript_117442/m.336921 type:complete len:245 (+) Transcript_117442:749-1483(+)